MELQITTTHHVKPEHIDCYGHLSNQYYPEYFLESRAPLLKRLGLGSELLKRNGFGLWVYKGNYTYRKQVKLEVVRIYSEVLLKAVGTRLRFEQRIMPASSGEILTEATVDCVAVDIREDINNPKIIRFRSLEELIGKPGLAEKAVKS